MHEHLITIRTFRVQLNYVPCICNVMHISLSMKILGMDTVYVRISVYSVNALQDYHSMCTCFIYVNQR